MQKIRYLIDPGFVSPGSATDILQPFDGSVRFIVERRRLEQYKNIRLWRKPLSFPDLSQSAVIDRRSHFNLPLHSFVLDDHQTALIYDRSQRSIFFESASFRVAKISSLIDQCDRIIREQCPEFVLFGSSPHTLCTWVFAKVAEFHGVKVKYLHGSVLPWRVFGLEGLSRVPAAFKFHQGGGARQMCDKEMSLIDELIEIKRSDGSEALPLYEKQRQVTHRGEAFRLMSSIRQRWRRPDLVVNAVRCFRAYEALATNTVPDYPYVIFFLHYQPERTTLPEGYGFAQQILAIKALASSLPPGVRILVKEHPSTFRNMCHWAERTPIFYQKITQEVGATLISMKIDSYGLIDRAVAIATITGTVAYESLIRGTPAVVFGVGGYYTWNQPDVHFYSNTSELARFLSAQSTSKRTHGSSSPRDNIKLIEGHTVSADLSGIASVADVESSRRVLRESALLNGIRAIVEMSSAK